MVTLKPCLFVLYFQINSTVQETTSVLLSYKFGGSEKSRCIRRSRSPDRPGDESPTGAVYLDEVYLVTALVPSLTACLASSPGRSRRTAVWISRLVIVERRL